MRLPLFRRCPIVVGAVGFLVVFFLTPVLWNAADRWLLTQRSEVWAKVEKAVGSKITYGRIAPAVLDALEFQNVQILGTDGSPVISIASVRFSWDWAMVLQGEFDQSLRKIQVINASLKIDSHRDSGLLDRWSRLFQTVGPGAGTPAFEVEGFNLTVQWTDGIRSLDLHRGFFLLAPERDRWSLKYRGALSWTDRSNGGTFARFSVRGDLKSDPSFQNFSLRTEVSQTHTTWFDLAPLTFQVAVDPSVIRVTKVADRIPLDLKAVFNRSENRWSFSGVADGFRPSSVVKWDLPEPWAKVTDGSLKGEFSYMSGGDFSFIGQVFWPTQTLPAPFDREPVLARGIVRTENGQFHFKDFQLESQTLAARFDGSLDPVNLRPVGTLILDHWTVPSVGEATGTIVLSSEGTRVKIQGASWRWNGISTSSPAGWVENQGLVWAFHLAGALDGTSHGAFDVGGVFNASKSSGSLDVTLSEIPFLLLQGELHRHLPNVEVPQDCWELVGGLRGTLGWADGRWSVTKTTFSVFDPVRTSRSLSGTLAWHENHLSVGVEPVLWDRFSGGLRFDADFLADGAIDAAASGHLWDRPLSLTGHWSPENQTLTFSGTPGVRGLVRKSAPGVWVSQIVLETLEIQPGTTLGFQGTVTLAEDNWDLDLDRVTLTGRYPWDQSPFSVQGHVLADSERIRVVGLTVSDSRGTLVGGLSTSWNRNFAVPWSGSFNLGTPETDRENVSVSWVGSSPTQWRFAVKAGGLDLSRAGAVLTKGIHGRLALEGTADWTGGQEWSWSAQSSLSEARWGDSPLGFRAEISGNSQVLSVRNLNFSVSPIHLADGAFDLDLGTGTWRGGSGVGIRLGSGEWDSRWEASGDWPQTGSDSRGTFILNVKENQWSHQSLPDWSLRGAWGTSGWKAALENGGLDALGGPDGSFGIRAKAPFPLDMEAEGTCNDGQIHLDVRNLRMNLDMAKDLVNSKPFSIKSGVLEGSFAVEGALTDPEVNGSLMLRDLRVASSFVKPVLGPVDVPVTLEKHQVRVDPVNLGPKGQVWMVSAQARLDHYLPEEYEVTVRTDALSVIPAVYEGSGIAANGDVTGYFEVKGTPLAVTLGGRLVCQDTSITLKDSKSDPQVGTPLGFNVDLVLVTGRKVEFLWPNESIPLIRAVTATNQTLAIRTNDVASTWSVVGKLALKTGEVNYLDQTFVIRNGFLGFQESQMSFDPRLSVLAELKVPEPTGTVTVNLHADGTLGTFSPRFDSTPYMSTSDLQQLLGLTLALPSDYSRSPGLNTALVVASDVGTSIILSPFEQLVRRNLQLDLFTVRTEILKRTFLNQNGASGPIDYLDNTRLFFGKYIGDDLFLQGTLAFSQDPLIVNQGSPQLIADPEFGMEFQTPFFLLNWTLEPQHPETLFVTDNTVTLRWDWSF